MMKRLWRRIYRYWMWPSDFKPYSDHPADHPW